MYLRISESERAAIIATRPRYGDERSKEQKSAQVAVFRSIKRRLGLDDDRKIKVEIDAPGNPNYLVVIDSATNRPIPDPTAAAPVPAYQPPPPTVKVDEPVKPRGATPSVLSEPTAGPALKVASITVEDALELLRAEGDMCTSYVTTTASEDGSVSIKDGRLYFVL